MKKLFIFMIAMLVAFSGLTTAAAYNVPQDSSRVQYFYVFGPDGEKLYGQEDSELTLYIDVPQEETRPVIIAVYDPNTGHMKDWRTSSENPWSTKTEFSVSGKKLLAKEEFGEEGYERSYYQFGPFEKTQGEKVGEFYRFKLVAKGLEGDDANLFKVKVSPDTIETFSYNITFGLRPHEGDKMYFYPQVPANTKTLIVKNYDIDKEGGMSYLLDPTTKTRYAINDSKSGQWQDTVIEINNKQNRRLEYIIVKATQKHGHAGLRIEDEKGNPIPIYFRKGAPQQIIPPPAPPKEKKQPIDKCNTFTFDATSSYDPDNQELDFLWEFGDGQTSPKPVVTHTYEKGGEYNVMLKVTDTSELECDTAIASQVVKVNTPPKAAFTAPELSCVTTDVVLDASQTYDDTSKSLSYLWNFGDGTKAEGKTVTKQYTKGGTYNVTLLVDDNENTTCSIDQVKKTIRVNTPPVANAGDDQELCLKANEEYLVALSAAKSHDADKDALQYQWDFGDGTYGSGEKTTHTYASSGTYNVRLTVNDGAESKCSLATDTMVVKLNKAPIANAGPKLSSCIENDLLFDGSQSVGEEGETLTYTWDFGDGATAQGQQVSHRYEKGGNYKVVLTVDDGKNTPCSISKDMTTATINGQPQVTLSQLDNACVGQTVTVKADAQDPDNDSLQYNWDFGDGTITKGNATQSHKYAKGGTYTIRVTVDDQQGSNCSIDTDSTSIKINTPPVADAGPNLVCCIDTESIFDGRNSSDTDNDSLSYYWDFGDGTKAQGSKVTHIYKEAGQYTVTLRVDDNTQTSCNTSIDSFTANVNQKPVPVIKIK